MLAQLDILEGEAYYYFYNGHGDAVQITDTAGNIKNSYDYDVWGNFIKKEESVHNPFTYFGQTYDEITGFYYLRARYYDPTTGRFTQQDPAEDGYNWYVYGNSNPVTYTDESGTIAVVDDAAIIYATGAVIAAAGATIIYYKEHTKGARGSTWNKHTKKRAGAPSTAEKKPGWKSRSNKKKPK